MENEKKTTAKKSKSIYAKGGRKTSTCQAFIFQGGNGTITVNGKDYKQYFKTDTMYAALTNPLATVGLEKTVNVSINVHGGGLSSQSEACRHAISRALEIINPEFRPSLKALGFLKRDPRVKERKKPGLKRARRAPQWSKR
ncbi:MAG: 30S ribosomal protein S9 [Candidatus Buchananbacteria bacterium]